MRRYHDTTMASFLKPWKGTAKALLTVAAVAAVAGWACPNTPTYANHGSTAQASGIKGPIYSALHGRCLAYYQANSAYTTYHARQPSQAHDYLDYGYDVSDTSKQLVVGLDPCTGKNSQKWTLPADNTIRIAGKCVDAGGKSSGTGVVLATCNGSGRQFWEADGIVRVAGVELINPRSGKCLTDPNGSTDPNTQIRLYTCKRSIPQIWYVPPTKP
jgi:Ricin-type beta-trefoil lectin domain